MTPRRRRLLGRHADVATRYRVYQVPDAVEVDEVTMVEIRRRRVFFDEVVLVTYHRFRQRATIAFLALAALPFLALGAVVLAQRETTMAAWFAGIGLVFAVPALLYAAVPAHAITVYGLRTSARIVVRFRGRRAREIFATLCREAAAAQRV